LQLKPDPLGGPEAEVTDRSRGIAEAFGLLLITASLLFVGFQMQQDRRIAQAELNTSQLEIFASRFSAGLESESYLAMWDKLYATKAWDPGDLSNLEVAAAELDAILWWTYIEVAFEQYREGLVSREAWEEIELEIIFVNGYPVMRAIYDGFWLKTPSAFTHAVDRVVKSSGSDEGL
jgi:hypothetical protein